MICTITAACSRPTICMKAGWIISTGMSNWSPEFVREFRRLAARSDFLRLRGSRTSWPLRSGSRKSLHLTQPAEFFEGSRVGAFATLIASQRATEGDGGQNKAGDGVPTGQRQAEN